MRLNKVICIVGGKGSGKTTLALQLLNQAPKKTLIVDTLDHPSYRQYPVVTIDKLKYWKNGIYRIYQGDTNEILTEVNTSVWNANIILEDAFKYLPFSMSKDQVKLFSDSKQHNQDIIVMFHAIKQIPVYLCSIMDQLVVMKTKERLPNTTNKFYNWEEIKEVHAKVSKHKNPHYFEVIDL
ncbi:MAG: ATP-binding protein [Chitinophagales bacterium]|nr:ATP-binding protein [Chitinophagales bacterium]